MWHQMRILQFIMMGMYPGACIVVLQEPPKIQLAKFTLAIFTSDYITGEIVVFAAL